MIEFKDTEGEKEAKLVVSLQDHGTVRLELLNFKNVLGDSMTRRLAVGTLNNRRLFLSFNIELMGSETKNRIIHYCWYLGEEVHDEG